MTRISSVVACHSLARPHQLTSWAGDTVTVIVHPVPQGWDPFTDDVPEDAILHDVRLMTRDERDRLIAEGGCEVTAFVPLTAEAQEDE